MGRARVIDYDEATRLRAGGMTIRQVAALLGCSMNTVQRATNPAYNERQAAVIRANLYSAVCPDCGGPRNRYHDRCESCAYAARATSVRPGELQCVTCREWKPDAEFWRSRIRVGRRGRHAQCKRCGVAERQRHRVRGR